MFGNFTDAKHVHAVYTVYIYIYRSHYTSFISYTNNWSRNPTGKNRTSCSHTGDKILQTFHKTSIKINHNPTHTTGIFLWFVLIFSSRLNHTTHIYPLTPPGGCLCDQRDVLNFQRCHYHIIHSTHCTLGFISCQYMKQNPFSAKYPGCCPESNDSNSGKVWVMRKYFCLILLPAFHPLTFSDFSFFHPVILCDFVPLFCFPFVCCCFFFFSFVLSPRDPLGYSYTSKCFIYPCDFCDHHIHFYTFFTFYYLLIAFLVVIGFKDPMTSKWELSGFKSMSRMRALYL